VSLEGFFLIETNSRFRVFMWGKESQMKTGIGHTRFCFPAMRGLFTGLFAVLAVGLAGCAQPKSQAPQSQPTVEVLSATGTKEVPERPKLKVRQVTGDARYAVREFPSVRIERYL
jgi:hypothetical protein